MSKLLPFLVAGVGASSVSVGGVFMLKKTGVGGNTTTSNNTSGVSEKSTQEQNLVFEDVNAFKEVTDTSKHECMKDGYFGNLNIKTSLSQLASQSGFSPASNTFFKTDAASPTTPFTSCLLINWKKTTYGTEPNAKGHGKFTGLGTFVRGDEGFINFNVAETNESDLTKLKFTGVFYLVGKNGSNWEIKHKKDSEENKASIATGDGSMFPKKGTALTDDNLKPYWEFLPDDGTLSNMCKVGSCGNDAAQTPKPTVQKLSWTGSSDANAQHQLKGGCESMTWGKTLFGTGWDLDTKLLDNFKGTGTKTNTPA